MKYPPTSITANNDTKTCHHKISEYQKFKKKKFKFPEERKRDHIQKNGNQNVTELNRKAAC